MLRNEPPVSDSPRLKALLALTRVTGFLEQPDATIALRGVLELASRFLDLPYGIVSRIVGQNYKVRVQVSPDGILRDGEHFPLGETYCVLTIEADDVVHIPHMARSGYSSHPCYRSFRLESYIGVPLHVDGQLYGTLNFSSPQPRTRNGFSDTEIEFVRLLGVWVSHRIQRWRLDESLRRSEARLNASQRIARTGSWEFDHASNSLYWSDECFRIFEIDSAPVGASYEAFLQAVHPADRATVNDAHAAAGNNASYAIDYRLLFPNGRIKYIHEQCETVDEDGVPARTIGTVQDVSERKIAEALRLEGEERLRELIDQAADAIFMADLDGRYTDVNRAGCRMLGYERDEIVGKTIMDFIPPKDVERLWESRKQMLSGGTHVSEWTLRRKDGSDLPVEVSAKILPDGRWQGMVRDISERKRNEQLKNEFVSTVSHELRTPLTSILGALGLLANGAVGPLPEQAREMIAIAYRNSQRLSRLIDDLLDMEKLAAGKMNFDMKVQPLMPLVEQAVKHNQSYAEQHRVHYRITERDDMVCVSVDAQRIQQVLANLLSNAAKFSPADSDVDIAVARRGDSVRISVRDRGPGIPEAFRDRIFEKFAQADSSDARHKGGTGLGLAISRAIVERMDGRMGFESADTQGTRFVFDLPLSR